MPISFSFPSQQRDYDGRRPMFGRSYSSQGGGVGSGFKMRLILALVVALFAVISYYGRPGDVNEVTGESERVALTEEADEVQLGLQAAPEMAAQYGGPSRDAAGRRSVEAMGWKLVQALDRGLDEWNKAHPDQPPRSNPYENDFHFTLLGDTETVNAFALPGGQVFITQALYDKLETEGQLAGVLGHEVGHVLSRHSNKQMARQSMFSGLAGAVGVLGGDANSARMGQMVAATIGMKYGREAELESDRWGVKLTALAGYDPRAMIGVMKVLEAASGAGGAPPEFFSTHPNPGNRIAHIEEEIEKEFPDGVPAGLKP